MPFGPHVIGLVETALAECFQYHDSLDSFVLRAGVSKARLAASRKRAEERSKQSPRGFGRAPKRFVAKELLNDLSTSDREDDQIVATIITGLCRGNFRDATTEGCAAIDSLKALRAVESQQAAQQRLDEERRRREQETRADKLAADRAGRRDHFRQSFLTLYEHRDPQQRGFALEKFLNDFFDYEGLNPRGSFKLLGEQIDGSFAWAGRTHLVEAKWLKDPVGGAAFGGLMYKIEGKTADTRGLFLAVGGYSPEAIKGLHLKGELRFICIDGTHLMHALSPGRDLPRLLDFLWRHASETGEAYVPVSSPAFLAWER